MRNFIQIGLDSTVEYACLSGASREQVMLQYLDRLYWERQVTTCEHHYVPRFLMEAIDYQPMRVIGVEIDAASVQRCAVSYEQKKDVHIWHHALRPRCQTKDAIDITLNELVEKVQAKFSGEVWGIAMSMNGGELDVLKNFKYTPVFLEVRTPEDDNAQALLMQIIDMGYQIIDKIAGNVHQVRAWSSDVAYRR